MRGRLPGARLAGFPSLSQNICPRVLRQKPSSGITGELCSQPPDGVRNHVAVPVDHVEVAGIAPPFDLRPGLALHGRLADAERPRHRRSPRRWCGHAAESRRRSRRSRPTSGCATPVGLSACDAWRCTRPTAASRPAPRRSASRNCALRARAAPPGGRHWRPNRVAESGKGDAKTRGSRSEAEIVGHRD